MHDMLDSPTKSIFDYFSHMTKFYLFSITLNKASCHLIKKKKFSFFVEELGGYKGLNNVFNGLNPFTTISKFTFGSRKS